MKTKYVQGSICASFLVLFTATVLALTTVNAFSCDPPPSGIIGWWPGQYNADDIIGTNNGILENGVTFTDGVVGEAFHFNGSNQDVQIPYSTTLEPTNITVECWVKLDALASPVAQYPGLQYIVFKQNSRGGNFEGYDLERTGSMARTVFRFQVTSVDGEQVPAASTTIPQPGVWYHLAGTYDGTTVKMYVNGVLEGTAVAGFPMDYGTEPVYFATTGQGFDGRFDGALDEVSIYNRALSPDEIAAIYEAGSDGKCSPTPVSNPNVPVITGFSPALGAAGAVVNISGLNFSPVASDNIVYFGAVQAMVSAASQTHLLVKVPAGATYGPITEIVHGLMAYANQPFVPTFHSRAPANFSLGSQLVMTASNGSSGVVIADFDGDGKPDVAINNGGSHAIDIYRNISPGGTLTASSFAPPVIIPIGTGGQNVMLAADLTGDGKLDLVCLDENSNLVMVLKNLCAPGIITAHSFAPAVNFTVGTDPRGAAVQDLDGDGKPEIVVANCHDSTVTVLRNTSTPGSITSNSFEPAGVFPTGTNPQNVMIADIDGDGEPDLVTVNNNYSGATSGMSVLRHIGTSRSIAFASHVDFPGLQDTYCIAIGDLDGDGKPDVVIGSQPGGQSVSVYRNTSTPGRISFAPHVDFAAGGWVNSIALGDLNGDGRLDVAAAMQLPSQMDIFLNSGTSTDGAISKDFFAAPLVYAAGYNANGIAIGDLNGDDAPDFAFANTYDGTFSIYQNTTPIYGITTVETVDHFIWNLIHSPQFRDVPFTVTITAQNATNGTVTSYTGHVSIVSSNGISVYPPVSGDFVHGAWTGNVIVSEAATNLVLIARDTAGQSGISNPFNVLNRPVLNWDTHNKWQFTWPADTSGFELEMTTNLASGKWVPVPGSSQLSGSQYIQPITPTNTNSQVFFRLHYLGQ